MEAILHSVVSQLPIITQGHYPLRPKSSCLPRIIIEGMPETERKKRRLDK